MTRLKLCQLMMTIQVRFLLLASLSFLSLLRIREVEKNVHEFFGFFNFLYFCGRLRCCEAFLKEFVFDVVVYFI